MSTTTPIIRRINSTDSCDRLVYSLHGECKRAGVFDHTWTAADGRLVACSKFERRGFTNRMEVAASGQSLEPTEERRPR